jgi:tetratricopeptide (TPR) repeat protein
MRWFQSKTGPEPSNNDPATSLPERLKLLEKEADQARLGFRGTPLNRAGDLCMQAKQSEKALEYYGRAIDAYLHDGHPELARGVAQKLIRVHPGAVRTYCTLTWLDLGLGYMADARTHVGGYVAAARRAGREDIAIPQVREMAKAVTDQGFRVAAATALEDLGDGGGARELKDAMPEQTPQTPDDATRERCFEAAKSSGGRTA